MKKAILISLALLAACAPAAGHAEQPKTFTVLLAGGDEANAIHVWLTPDGRSYVIDSIVPLEVGGSICANPEGNPNELICEARSIAGFEVNAGGGDDKVSVAKKVQVPVTMRGGGGDDTLLSAAGGDKLIGGTGNDKLAGWRGADLLLGGHGDDTLLGGPDDDALIGGPGKDTLLGGRGDDFLRQHRAKRKSTRRQPSGQARAAY